LWCFPIWRLLASLSVALTTGITATAVAQTTIIKRRIVYGLKRLSLFHDGLSSSFDEVRFNRCRASYSLADGRGNNHRAVA
jgi:hypothetical protein